MFFPHDNYTCLYILVVNIKNIPFALYISMFGSYIIYFINLLKNIFKDNFKKKLYIIRFIHISRKI